MKLKLLVTLFMVGAMGLGFVAGRLQAHYSLSTDIKTLDRISEAERSARAAANYLRGIEMPAARRACADFSHAAGILESIRSGDTNQAIATLEGDLDTNIGLIGGVLLDQPAEARDPQCLSRIRWYRSYRAAHPSQEESTLSDHVLSLLSTNL